MSESCDCCGGEAPDLTITRIACGYTAVSTHAPFAAKLAPISQMRFLNRGGPYDRNYSILREGFAKCNGGPFDGCHAIVRENEIETGMRAILSYAYDDGDGCQYQGITEVAGSASMYSEFMNCGSGMEIYDDASGPAVITGAGYLGISWSGIMDGVMVTNRVLSRVGFPVCVTPPTTETRSLTPTAAPLGYQEYYAKTGSSTATFSCGDETCVGSYDETIGLDTPDAFRLRFSFTSAGNPGANHCRVYGKIYFKPRNISADTWGAEVEHDTIDFKWKTGDPPVDLEWDYPDLGVFRLGIIAVYLAGAGKPVRYEFAF